MNALTAGKLISSILLLVGIAACAQMHNTPQATLIHPEKLPAGAPLCSSCHQDPPKGSFKPYASFDHTPTFVKQHRFVAGRDALVCAACHSTSFCTDCHANKTEIQPSVKFGDRPDRTMPHRGDYLTKHMMDGRVDPASCYRCHGRANNTACVACHKK